MLFDANRARLPAVEAELGENSRGLQESRTALTIERTTLTERAAEISAELTSLQSRPNLLPRPQLELRRGCVRALESRTTRCRTPGNCCGSATGKPSGRAPRNGPSTASRSPCWSPPSITRP
ncbi:hypothetical protein ACOM2C_17180 [Pseudarthrobacter sp. So.54]